MQPGVESLSTHILKIMRKLSTGMRNVELIKWCTYYGINNLYNILVQFPGETAEDYRLQSEVVAKIPHFQPPYAIVKARADRGSPMYSDPDVAKHREDDAVGLLPLHLSAKASSISPASLIISITR